MNSTLARQAYLAGFYKEASAYGLSKEDTIALFCKDIVLYDSLKTSNDNLMKSAAVLSDYFEKTAAMTPLGYLWDGIKTLGGAAASGAKALLANVAVPAMIGAPILAGGAGATLALLQKSYVERHGERAKASRMLSRAMAEFKAKEEAKQQARLIPEVNRQYPGGSATA